MSRLEDLFFKRLPLWVVGMIVVLLLGFSVLTGWGVFHIYNGGHRLDNATGDLLLSFVRTPQTLRKVFQGPEGDLACSEQRFDGESGFTYAYAPGERSDAPYLLLNRYDAERKQSVSELIDLNTQEKVHTWAVDVDPVWDTIDFKSKLTDLKRDAPTNRFRNDHTLLLQDGTIIFHPGPLLKFDKSGSLVWVNDKWVFHHSIELDHDGNIWAPSHIEPSTVAIGNDSRGINPFLDDALTQLSPDGNILFSKSVTHILDENGLGHLVYGRGTDYSDPIHLNDIQPVLEDGEFWKKGDVFLSLRNQSMVLLYRPSTNKVLWYSLGPWRHEHDVDVISSHEIGVFNNNASTKRGEHQQGSWSVDGNNQYLSYDFRTKHFANPFKIGFEKLDIRTVTEGRGQPYPYGRLFVEETNYGRLVVFDKQGTVDWQFINRAKDGKVYLVSWSRLVSRSVGDAVRKLVNK